MPSSVKLLQMTPADIPLIWEFVVDDLSRAVKENDGESGLDDLLRSLLSGQHILWLAWDGLNILGCCTTFIHDYPKKRALFVSLLAGRNFREIAKLEDGIARHAMLSGCTEINTFVVPRVAALIERITNKYKTTHEVMVRKL